MFYMIYKTTNLVNGKIYIGAHKTKNLNDGYMGSGKILQRAIEKHGVENFTVEHLHVFETAQEMFDMESLLVDEDFVRSEGTYNLKLGGHGGFDYINEHCGNQGERLNKLLTPEMRKENGQNSNNTKSNWSQEKKEDFSLKNSERLKIYYTTNHGTFKGKKHTEETKAKMSASSKGKSIGSLNSQFGKMWISNVSLKEIKMIKQSEPIPEGWVKGRNIWNLPLRNCKKCGIEFRGTNKFCDEHSNLGMMWVTDNINETLISKSAIIPEGWRRGRPIK